MEYLLRPCEQLDTIRRHLDSRGLLVEEVQQSGYVTHDVAAGIGTGVLTTLSLPYQCTSVVLISLCHWVWTSNG